MFAEINDIELYYEVLGEENEPTIVAMHGGPGVGDHAKPKAAFEPLTDDYRLVVFDHRGCGQSEVAGPLSNEQFAADAEALRQHLGLDKISLYGGSYGGFIAQEYAVRYPENLAGLILRDTAATPQHDEAARENARAGFPKIKERGIDVPEITLEELDRVFEGDVYSDKEFARIFHGMLPLYAPDLDEFDADEARESIATLTFHHETHNAMFSEAHPNMDYTPALPDVDVPALVTVGRHDWITPVEASEEIAELLPDSRLVIFEESGHSPNLDQQDKYLKEVRTFFDEIGFDGK